MKRKSNAEISPVAEGVSYLMDSIYLSNQKQSGEWPVGEPIELYIFLERWKGGKKEQKFVQTIAAPTEEEALDQLRVIASRSDVTLMEEATRKEVPKDFLTDKQLGPG